MSISKVEAFQVEDGRLFGTKREAVLAQLDSLKFQVIDQLNTLLSPVDGLVLSDNLDEVVKLILSYKRQDEKLREQIPRYGGSEPSYDK